MHARPALPPGTPAARSDRLSNRVAVRARRHAVGSTYRVPSVVPLKPGPLRKLAWIFGLR